MQPKFNKFLTTYITLANVIDSFNENETYCPWCNPDELLKIQRCKPRICGNCEEIREHICSLGKYTKKYLNDLIVAIKSPNYDINETKHLRGEKLSRILNDANLTSEILKNDKILAKINTEIINKVEQTFLQ